MSVRRQQGSNLRGQCPTDFKSVSLTTRTYRLLEGTKEK
ncbi:histone H4-like protein [Corchorus olitorius]|uniref:Histone H4-like protein n=1 Tax=Corchorus olitorius TaxID=93759 RepID=A0A1R3IZY0_9ROSI|nr:histone H4-like protein [Corchorus olitorius]